MKKIVLLSLFSLFLAGVVRADPFDRSLKEKIEKKLMPDSAIVGVAIWDNVTGDTLTIDNHHHYPMQSTYKLPLAICVLHLVDQGKLSLEQKVHVTKRDLRRDTWSPLQDKYPEGNIDISISELLQYTVSQSDNNGCDILFRLVGGTSVVNDYVHSLGVQQIAIVATEYEMTTGWNVQYTNWAEPYAYIQLLTGIFHQRFLSRTTNDFLLKIMAETSTGPKRIKGLLPEGTLVAHKTGTSGTNKKRKTAATNDVGLVTLPGGRTFAIVVFVSDSHASPDTNERVIAEVARVVYDYIMQMK